MAPTLAVEDLRTWFHTKAGIVKTLDALVDQARDRRAPRRRGPALSDFGPAAPLGAGARANPARGADHPSQRLEIHRQGTNS